MRFFASALFLLVMTIITPFLALYTLLHFACHPHTRRRSVDPWVSVAAWCVQHILGIRYHVHGTENIPTEAAIILCKHQSAWETIFLQKIFPHTVFVWKREILWLPFFGWALAVHPSIAINRSDGLNALRQLEDQGKKRLAQGFSIVIFPEGTRLAPGVSTRFKAGGARLAIASGAPVIPVALNSGEFWPRHAFIKRPGVVTVHIGAAIIPQGLTAHAINTQAQQWIEEEMRRISPNYYDARTHTS